MKNGKRMGVFFLACLILVGSMMTPRNVLAEEGTMKYENAKIISKGSEKTAAVIKGDNAVIVRDEEKNSKVLMLNGAEENGGYLALPEDLYAGVTDGFSVAMDLFVMDKALNYQRIFQSTPIKLGTGNTGAWDASDFSVDLCEFANFRTSVMIGTGATASGKTTFHWGNGAVKGEWKRLIITVSKEKAVMYYGGEAFEAKVNRTVWKRLLSEGILDKYCYNALGRSVYNTDTDICAMYDNVAFYTYALNEEQALAAQLPEDAKYIWDFEDDSIEFSEEKEAVDSMSQYTDGTELTKLFEVASPSEALVTGIYTDAATGRYFHSTAAGEDAILHASKFGMVTESVDLSAGLELVEDSVKREANTEYNELTFTLKKEKATLTVIMRVYEDGMAYRYVIEEEGVESGTILSEASEVVFPEETVVWAGEPNDTYEGKYHKRTIRSIKNSVLEMSRPLLASVQNDEHWVLMTEASVFNVEEPYCASIFGTEDGEKNIRWIFGRKQETSPVVSYPFTSPWRVAIITDNINDLAGSDLVAKLNPPADETKDWSFVKPGKAVWSWWGTSYDAIEPQTQKDYIDFAAANGWEYCLVDYGWELWDDYQTKVADIVAYGKEKGVDVFVWYGVDKYDGAHVFDLDNRTTIDEQFAWCQSIGVAGVKVDYINSDTQTAMKILYDLADSAAEHKLMLIYHGCTNPNGEDVTYPNIVSYEAVRGQEYFKWNGQADVATLLTYLYTRNVTGNMDFTPTAYRLSNSETTYGFQLAQTIVYESSVQHFAHSAYVYEGSKVLGFLNQVPTVWDASIYGGYPGEFNWTARKHGADWYVGAMTAEARELELPLDFLEEGKTYNVYLYHDDATGKDLEIEKISVTAKDVLKLSLLANGGAAAIITEREIETVTSYERDYTYYEAEDEKIGGAGKIDVTNYASGLAHVSWLGMGAANDVTFEHVTVDKAGTYEMKLYFSSGSKRDLYISINGGEPIVLKGMISYANDWQASCRETIMVELKEGVNTIRMYNEKAYAPNIDRIAIAKLSEEEKAAPTETPVPTSTPEPEPTDAPEPTTAPAEDIEPDSTAAETPKKSALPWIAGGVAVLGAIGAAVAVLFGKKKK
ncbi:MAG: hypothetical protein E7260_04780 [Lachnospiraceae bacterium]|nr:hypothetical protein [Lachnospiraceae bacterium]